MHRGVAGVSQMSQAGGEIRGIDEQAVDAVDPGDRIDLAQGLLGLDLDQQADLFVRTRQIVPGAAEAVGTLGHGYPSTAMRWIARGFHHQPHLLGRPHLGDEEAALRCPAAA